MKDIESTLDDIARLRDQLAAGSRFQGLAPGVVALTGGAALGLGAWQAKAHSEDLFIWIILAAMCAMAIGTEAIIRARRLHRSMADRMLNTTLNRFMPAASAAGMTGMMVLLYAPEHSRFLPGIWQLLMGVGIFAMIASLPKQMVWAAGFYFASGTASLALSVGDTPATAWLMGVPFGLGQLLVAAILHRASTGASHGQK